MDLNLPPILPNTNPPAEAAAAPAPAQNTWPIESALHSSLIGLALSYLPGREIAQTKPVSTNICNIIEGTPFLFFKVEITKARAITNPVERTKALSSLAFSLTISGDRVRAKATFEEAIAEARTIESAKERTKALSSLATTQAKSGNIEEAKATFEEAIATVRSIVYPYGHGQEQVKLLCDIAISQAKSGDIEGSKATFKIAIAIARSIVSPHFQFYALLNIAISQVKSGDTAGAKATLKEVNIEEASWNQQILRQHYLLKFGSAQAIAGDPVASKATFKKAIDEARALSDTRFEPCTILLFAYPQGKSGVLQEIAIAQARSGDIEGAKVTAALITNPVVREQALNEIAAAERSLRQQ